MFSIVFAIHILICLGIIGLVLIQQGKGAEAGAVFGSNSESVLGPGGAPSFLTKLTTGLAIAFMLTSVLLVKSYMASGPVSQSESDVLEGSVVQQVAPVDASENAATEVIEEEAVEESAVSASEEVPETAAPETTSEKNIEKNSEQ